MSTHTQQTISTESCELEGDRNFQTTRRMSREVTGDDRSVSETVDSSGSAPLAVDPAGRSVDWSDSVEGGRAEEDVMQISGKGHWFLEGWIGDHAVDFLVDSGSAVTAVSRSFFNRLREMGAPVGPVRQTDRRLRGANGSQIEISGCSYCMVSFLGLRAGFDILVCDLSTDAIIGTDTLGSVLPHTLDIKKGLLFTEGGVSLQLHRKDAALSGRVFTVGHCSVPPHSEAVLHCTTRTVGGRSLPPSGLLEGLTVFSENTGLVVGRTLVDPSGWRVPVLVSNFSQDTVMVEPFSEVGMIAQVSAIQPAMDETSHASCDPAILPEHLQDLLERTSGDLDDGQRSQLAGTLLRFVDLFPIPGSTLTGHTDAVEHNIDTGECRPVRCAPRCMSSQKIKREEACVNEMLAGGQIEPSESPWSAPVVLVTKKDGGTRFCVDYRKLNLATTKDAYPLPRIDDTLDMLAGKQWFSTLDLASGYWQVSLSPEARCKTAFATHSGLFQFRVMPFGLCNAPATFERLMDRVLQGLRWSRCLVYLDDIISFGTTFRDSLDNLVLIFERLRSYGLQLKSSKCQLFRSSVPFLGHVVGREGLRCDPRKIEDVLRWPVPDCLKSVRQFLGFVGYYRRFIQNFADLAEPLVALTGKDVPFVWSPACEDAFTGLRDAMVRSPILAFPTETGEYMLDTDASNFGLGGVLSQIQNGIECVIAYCSRALRPSQRKYCTTKREMLAVVSMCVQFRSYLRGARFTLRTDHKSLVWLHRFKDTEGMMARWLHTLHQFQFTIIHRAGRDHGNADGLSRAPTDPCRQCTRVECPRVDTTAEVTTQPFDDASVADSEDDDLIPIQSGEDWVAQLDDDLSRPASQSGEVFKIAALQREDATCTTLLGWIRSDDFPPWAEVKSMCPELRFLWHHRNNLSADTNGVLWRKRSSQTSQLQLLVPKPGRNGLFLSYHATLIAGHLGRNRTLARLSQRFYWSGMADDVGDWLRNCTTCLKRKSPAGRHHPLGNIPTGHRWDRIAMDILDVCDPTPDGFRYILVIADYFSKWTEAFPIKNKCADTVAEVLVDKIILRFGMPLVIHSDQGREFENGLMKSLCTLLGCVKTRTAPYHPESDGMVERFNRTCLMMLSMFVNDRRDNWHELLPFVMHAYRTSVHESTGYSPYRLMMGEECSLPQDLNTEELRANRESDVAPHPFAAWVRDALEVAYDHVRHSLHRTAARRKRLYDVKAVNRKFPVGSWVLRYYPPAAQKKLGSPWIGPQLVVRQATGHTVGIQKDSNAQIIFIHVDDLKLCPAPTGTAWTPEPSTAKSLCASTVAFRPGSHNSELDSSPSDNSVIDSSPSVAVSTWTSSTSAKIAVDSRNDLDSPIELNDHVLSPFAVRDFHYQDCHFHSVAHLMCYRYAVLNDFKLMATSVRKWSKHLTEFPIVRFVTQNWQILCRSILGDIYSHLCLNDVTVSEALVNTGPRPFVLRGHSSQGALNDIVNDTLIDARVACVAGKLTCTRWLQNTARRGGLRNARR